MLEGLRDDLIKISPEAWAVRGGLFDVKHSPEMDSLNSFGNTETVPPFEKDGISYPFGRVIRGSVKSWFPDPTFAKMIHSQGQQPEILVDTSWLLVGHIDETISFVKAPTKPPSSAPATMASLRMG